MPPTTTAALIKIFSRVLFCMGNLPRSSCPAIEATVARMGSIPTPYENQTGLRKQRRGSALGSTAHPDHVLLRASGTGALERVTCALAGDRRGDRRDHVVVGAAAAHHIAQAHRVVVAEA